jgi:hypothetical protein
MREFNSNITLRLGSMAAIEESTDGHAHRMFRNEFHVEFQNLRISGP